MTEHIALAILLAAILASAFIGCRTCAVSLPLSVGGYDGPACERCAS